MHNFSPRTRIDKGMTREFPPFPRLRGWKASGWHTFFLSLVHALAHSHAAKFAIFGHETALWHETWLSPERKAFSKQQNPRSEKSTRDRRGQAQLDACQNAVSWPKTPGFAARSRKGRTHGRKTRIRSAKRPEWKARPPSDVPYACCTPNAWSHPKAPTRPATDPPPPPPLHCRRTGGRSQAALPCSQTVLPRSQAAQRPPRQAPHPPRQRSASTVPVAALPPCSRLTGYKAAFSRRRRRRGASREAICTRSHTAATAS